MFERGVMTDGVTDRRMITTKIRVVVRTESGLEFRVF